MEKYEIRSVEPKDAKRILEIFKQGIEYGLATFETQVPTWEAWDSDFYNFSRFVIEDSNDHVIGWIAIKPTSKRECFSGVAELSLYIDKDYHGLGLGKLLMKKLIQDSEEHQIWTLYSGIFPENKASIALHEKVGFRTVGTRERIGKHLGKWVDIVIMERRSDVVGID